LNFLRSGPGRLLIVLGALLLRGCATHAGGYTFPEPPVSPAWTREAR
jgi:hypothetical protein